MVEVVERITLEPLNPRILEPLLKKEEEVL